ncbi:hypothetical protein [Stenomitos frigidus]|uniref:Uncharacterized protein n=1 Tax=Stenomitos frigidus ULC18 TaxID=2107698 RepID=A0A2T1ESE5_9CYAN|nr:hypothetical protein [Stenomitos frigidus]PSB35649.1 hypothetical protein C7B82_00515 [Stenomitos frigidus ULC18]
MTELVKHSTERSSDAAAYAVSLLHHYGFDLGDYTIAQLLVAWQEQYPAAWIRLATIEALYQGRYKAISVDQILALWQRRSQPLYHFNHEFERLVCDNFPESLLLPTPSPQNNMAARSTTRLETRLPYHSVALKLPSFEGVGLPESDVMLALRTLHSEEMALLAEAQKIAETDEQDALQTYSYKLRSNEPANLSGEQPEETSTQSKVDSTDLAESFDPKVSKTTDEAVQIDAMVQTDELIQPDDLAQSEPIALTVERSEQEPVVATEPLPETPTALTLPDSAVQAPISQTASIARILQQLDDQALKSRAAFPGFGLMTHELKPKLQLHLTARYQPIWLTESSSNQPIHQFSPDPEQSGFHNKLKAVAQPTEASAVEESAEPPES